MGRESLPIAALVAVALLAAGCAGGEGGRAAAEGRGRPGAPVPLRLGYFPNITHATALVGLEAGIFERVLGPGATLEPKAFNAGPSAVEALFAGALDAAYIGPNPAINAFVRSRGEAVRVLAGATAGGAFLVVRPEITSAGELRGKKVASPQLGGTQDVALRSWLAEQGLRTTPHGGGDVSVVPQENAQSLDTFRTGTIAGAWVPEPWATRLVQEAGGVVMVDERDLWPGGRYVTTQLIVRTRFLRQHPGLVRRLVEGHVEATDLLRTRPAEAKWLANEAMAAVTSKFLPPEVMDAAWRNLDFTVDPMAASLQESADAATRLGFLPGADLSGLYELAPLNEALERTGRAGVGT